MTNTVDLIFVGHLTKKMKSGLLLLLVLLCCCAKSVAQEVHKIEPPFWWAGMKSSHLQLMVYGKEIAALQAAIDYNGLSIEKIERAESNSYLFIDLQLAVDIRPGKFNIRFTDGTRLVNTYTYELKARATGSAQRKGFDNTDVLYLITPDRFANGSPANDSIGGLREGYNRSADFGRHGGDIAGIRQHLDYIKDMGFTAIWLNPVLENDQPKWSYHGYATTDYYKVDSRFGSNEEYVDLSKQAKANDIGMIMDIIVNHCGSEHPWMKDPPFGNWFNGQDQPYQQTNHRKSTLLDPYVSSHDRAIMAQGWFVPAMPDLNQRNAFLSTYLIQNSIWWIEYADLAGIRQDTYSYPFREFMTDWTCAIMEEYPYFNIVGEEWVENAAIISYWQQGKVNKDGYRSCLPSLMDFPMTFALHKALTEEEGWSEGLMRLYENLANDFLYADPNALVIFPDNHDMSRIFTQLNEDVTAFKMAMAYMLTMRGIPQLYYGTEVLMSHTGTDSHGVIRSDFPGGWPGDAVNAFTGQGLSADALDAQGFLKKLLQWRKGARAVHFGRLMHFEPQNGVYVYFRYLHGQAIMVVLNKNTAPVELPLDRFAERLAGYQKGKDVLTGRYWPLADRMRLENRGVLVLECE